MAPAMGAALMMNQMAHMLVSWVAHQIQAWETPGVHGSAAGIRQLELGAAPNIIDTELQWGTKSLQES